MARYGSKARSKVKRAMHKRKRGTLRSGRSGKRVKSRKQAIAIGLAEVKPRIQQQLVQNKVEELVRGLRAKAKVE